MDQDNEMLVPVSTSGSQRDCLPYQPLTVHNNGVQSTIMIPVGWEWSALTHGTGETDFPSTSHSQVIDPINYKDDRLRHNNQFEVHFSNTLIKTDSEFNCSTSPSIDLYGADLTVSSSTETTSFDVSLGVQKSLGTAIKLETPSQEEFGFHGGKKEDYKPYGVDDTDSTVWNVSKSRPKVAEIADIKESELYPAIKNLNRNPKFSLPKKTISRRWNGYVLYAQVTRQLVIQENPTYNFGEISKRVALMWNKLTPNEQKKWKKDARKRNMTLSGFLSKGQPPSAFALWKADAPITLLADNPQFKTLEDMWTAIPKDIKMKYTAMKMMLEKPCETSSDPDWYRKLNVSKRKYKKKNKSYTISKDGMAALAIDNTENVRQTTPLTSHHKPENNDESDSRHITHVLNEKETVSSWMGNANPLLVGHKHDATNLNIPNVSETLKNGSHPSLSIGTVFEERRISENAYFISTANNSECMHYYNNGPNPQVNHKVSSESQIGLLKEKLKKQHAALEKIRKERALMGNICHDD